MVSNGSIPNNHNELQGLTKNDKIKKKKEMRMKKAREEDCCICLDQMGYDIEKI